MKEQIYAESLVKEFKIKSKRKFFSFPETKVLKAVDNVNLKINEGEIVAFIGPNGAGKSTTIKILTGIIHATSGKVLIEGLSPIYDRKELTYKIGCMFGQKSQLYMHLSVIESFTLIGSIYDMSKEKINSQIEYISKLFNIEHLLYRTVKSLSLGQRMICEIAGSIIHEPKIIFLDEPTIGLDVIAKHNVREVIKKLNKEKNTTIFLTSHDVGDVEAICDRIIVIDKGKIVKDSSITNIRKEYFSAKDITIYASNVVNRELLKLNGFVLESLYIHKNIIKVTINSNKCNIIDFITYISSIINVIDIQVQSISMEDVITKIYEENK